MSEREIVIAPLTRENVEKLQSEIERGRQERKRTISPSSQVQNSDTGAVRTEGDGRSAEPVTEDLFTEKTNSRIAKEETLSVNNTPGKEKITDKLLGSMSDKSNEKEEESENDDEVREDESTQDNEEEEEDTQNKQNTEADQLNAKYADDNEVNYNNLYENLPSEGEEENYLPEEFRIPSSISSASSNYKRSEREETQKNQEKQAKKRNRKMKQHRIKSPWKMLRLTTLRI